MVERYGADTIAAVIVEPMGGSAGVLPPPQGYLQRLRTLCDKHNVLLIFDEVITGFGRCGAMTGADAFGVTPDILNVAKQLTNGAVPMGAVIASSEVHETFMANAGPDYVLEFAHGYTYSAHPVACAAGLAALDVLVEEDLPQRVAAEAPYFESLLHDQLVTSHSLPMFETMGLPERSHWRPKATSRSVDRSRWLWRCGNAVSSFDTVAIRSRWRLTLSCSANRWISW